jgi:DNA-binding transcriptional LysR family regulator
MLPPPLPMPTAKPRLIGDDILFVCQAVKAGAGLGVLPTFLAREEVAAGRLVRVLPRVSLRLGTIYLVHPPAQHVPRKVTALRDYLVEHFAAHPLVGRSG